MKYDMYKDTIDTYALCAHTCVYTEVSAKFLRLSLGKWSWSPKGSDTVWLRGERV